MGDIVNLNKARKRRDRAAAQRQAAANRLKFGRTPAERERDAAEAEEAQRRMDRLRREPPPPEKP